jgi:hypothetical protein
VLVSAKCGLLAGTRARYLGEVAVKAAALHSRAAAQACRNGERLRGELNRESLAAREETGVLTWLAVQLV